MELETTWIDITVNQRETIVGSALIGTIVGSLLGGPMGDNYGRKVSIILGDISFATGSIVMSLTPSIGILILGRFMVGVGVGLTSMVVPVYLSEIAPTEIRGRMTSFYVFNQTAAMVIAYFVCYLCGSNWRLMMAITAIPAIVQLLGILNLSETPIFLLRIASKDEAIEALTHIYKHPYIHEKISEIQQEVKSVQ